MLLLDPQTAIGYLRQRGELFADESAAISELAGGVSNQVLLVQRERGDRFVLKQAREQLRTQQEWRCDLRRIWREVEVLTVCENVLQQNSERGSATPAIKASVPTLVFEDRENYCYAMSAAPAEYVTWKDRLLAGNIEPEYATAAGDLLGTLHAGTWQGSNGAAALSDRDYFQALRVDPYYRRVAEVHPSLREAIERLICSLENNSLSLVHGDVSPKNCLVWYGNLMLIDFEVGHYGDPAFDLGFFLSHLFLKTLHRSGDCARWIATIFCFWDSYSQRLTRAATHRQFADLESRAMDNLAGCLLARIDGKSPVDYLNSKQQAAARHLAIELLTTPSGTRQHAADQLQRSCAACRE